MIRRLACYAILVLAAACTSDGSLSSGSPLKFQLLDSLVLQETPQVYLGKPELSFTIDDQGFLYLVDNFWNHTVRYRPDGTIDRVFGKVGPGPGEFHSTTAVTIVSDSTSARLLAPMQLALPPEYAEFPGLTGYASSVIVVWKDSILAGFGGVDYLVLTDSAGATIDSLDIPRLRRKGSPPEVQALFAPGKKELDFDQKVAAISQLFHIWRLPNGRFLVWYQQNHSVTVGDNSKLTGHAYLTLLSKDRKRACVDGEIPFPGTEWPRFGMRGDTLLALDQVSSASDSSRSISVIRRYVVSDSGCTWLPVKHRPGRGRQSGKSLADLDQGYPAA